MFPFLPCWGSLPCRGCVADLASARRAVPYCLQDETNRCVPFLLQQHNTWWTAAVDYKYDSAGGTETPARGLVPKKNKKNLFMTFTLL